jgi:hypothetical protein
MTRTKMKKELLLGTVALMAGIGLASAQGLREGGSAGGSERGTSQMSPGSGTAQRGSETRSEGAADHKARSQSDRQMKQEHVEGEGSKKATSGQANDRQERSTTGQGSAEKSESAKGSASKEESKSKDEDKAEGKSKGMTTGQTSTKGSTQGANRGEKSATGKASPEKNEQSTGGQGPRGGGDNKAQSQPDKQQPAQTQAPDAAKQNQTTGSATRNQNATQTQDQNATQQSGAAIQSQAGTKITAQQQTTIQQSVLSARNSPHVDHVNFAVHTGAVVPTSVRVVAVSTFPVLIDVFPQYRDHSFFVVEDEVVIVDRAHKVVDVVPAGPRARFSRSSSGSSAVVAVDLSEPEIREVQQVLIQRGFLHGRVTGVWGAETREALIAFQRKERFEASGGIDTRTVTALGLSGKVKAQSSTSTQGSTSTTTTGQGQSGTSGQSTTTQNPPTQNQSTTGQDKSSAQKPSDKQSSGPSQSTTGQGSSAQSGGSSSSSTPGHSSSPSSPSGTSGQSNMPEKNKQN